MDVYINGSGRDRKDSARWFGMFGVRVYLFIDTMR